MAPVTASRYSLRAPASIVSAICLSFGAVLTAALPASASADDVAHAAARVQELEGRSAAASADATVARGELAQSQDRVAQVAAQVDAATAAWASEQREMAQLARQLYVNGGVTTEAITLALDDPDKFLRSLDRLAVATDSQRAAVGRAAATAEQLRQARASQENEIHRLLQVSERLRAASEAAAVSLNEAQATLASLQEDERRQVAEQVAAARAAAAAAAPPAPPAAPVAAQPVEEPQPTDTEDPAPAPSRTFRPLPRETVPAPTPRQTEPSGGGSSSGGGGFGESAAWAATSKPQSVIQCESGGNYSINTGNGYYGAWQFDYSSWHANGGGQFAEYPHQASKAQQDFVAWTYWKKSGWGPWACG